MNWVLTVSRVSADVDRGERAKALLKSGVSVSDIAAELGYRSTGIFRRAFRNQVGLYPYAWLKQYGWRKQHGIRSSNGVLIEVVAFPLRRQKKAKKLTSARSRLRCVVGRAL